MGLVTVGDEVNISPTCDFGGLLEGQGEGFIANLLHHLLKLAGEEWKAICVQIDGLYEWGTFKEDQYRHAGTDLEIKKVSNNEIKVNQAYYIDMISNVDIPADRMRQEKAALNQDEVAACRTTLGSLQWLACQTQPQLSARCNILTSELLSKKTMEE